ncbi:MAG: TonB-dependent receptor [Bradyrhizobium sp.]|nr:TonB-dependent receptor [Bradyrhizobium sp.]
MRTALAGEASCLTLAIGLLLLAPTAAAQAGPSLPPGQTAAVDPVPGAAAADAQAGDGQGLDDIVVTARRREERLQNVPIAATALGGTAIERSGIVNVLDLAQRTPGITMTQYNVGEPQTYIRGVGSQTDSAASEPSVLIAQDEVPIGRGGASPVAFLDVERIEVLRGPQGTLYGRNASAGAISFYARRPEDRLGGSIEGSYGSFDSWGAKGVLNVPLTDGVAARAALQYSSSDGYARNIRTGEKLQGGERWAGRLSLAGRFDRLSVLVTGDFARDDLTGDSRYDVGGYYSSQPILALIKGLQASYGDVWDSSGFPGAFQNRRNYGLAGRLDYDASFATVTSLTAWRRNDYSFRADLGGLPAPFAFLVDDRVTDRQHQFSQELRLASNGGGIKWVAGLFYYDDNVDRAERFIVTPSAPLPAALGGDNTAAQTAGSTSYAAFGQASIPFAGIFELTLGARLTHDRKTVFQQAIHNGPAGQGLGFPFFPGSLYAVPAEASFTRPTWRATLAAELAPGKHVYLSYDRGYKSGTFTSQAQNAVQATFLVQPEQIDSFNLGAKTEWLGGTFRFNIDAYYVDYRKLQVFEFGSTLNFVLANADATVKGVEIEMTARPSPRFRAGANFSWMDSKFVTNPSFAGATLPYKGNVLPRAPRYKVSPFVEANAPVAGGSLVGRVSYDYQSDFFYNPSNDLAGLQKGYGLLGAYIGWTGRSGYKISLTGTNLANTRYSVHHISFQNAGFRIFGPPRAVTLTVGKSF